jgi:hypothetical protein
VLTCDAGLSGYHPGPYAGSVSQLHQLALLMVDSQVVVVKVETLLGANVGAFSFAGPRFAVRPDDRPARERSPGEAATDIASPRFAHRLSQFIRDRDAGVVACHPAAP